MKSDTSRFSTPDLDTRHSGVPKVLCIMLSVVCVALIAACVWLTHSLHAEQARLQVEQTHRKALELSGENVIHRATEMFEEIDAERIDALRAEGGGLYFGYAQLFEKYVEETWDYTTSCISGDDSQ